LEKHAVAENVKTFMIVKVWSGVRHERNCPILPAPMSHQRWSSEMMMKIFGSFMRMDMQTTSGLPWCCRGGRLVSQGWHL